MNEILEQIVHCIEFGKINKTSLYLPDMKNQNSVIELIKQAIEVGCSPDEILRKGFIPRYEIN